MAWRPGSVSGQRSPGNFFWMLLSSRANCIALAAGTPCTHTMLFPNAWMAEMHPLSACVNSCCIAKYFSKPTYVYLFPGSMGNLLIETSTVKTFPRCWVSSVLQATSVHRCHPHSQKQGAQNKGDSRCLSCSYLACLCHFTQHPWGVTSPILLTKWGLGPRWHQIHPMRCWPCWRLGKIGGWLAAVVCWHMQYLLMWISWQQHGWAGEPCANPFTLRVVQYLAAVVHGALCVIWCCCLSSAHKL